MVFRFYTHSSSLDFSFRALSTVETFSSVSICWDFYLLMVHSHISHCDLSGLHGAASLLVTSPSRGDPWTVTGSYWDTKTHLPQFETTLISRVPHRMTTTDFHLHCRPALLAQSSFLGSLRLLWSLLGILSAHSSLDQSVFSEP